MSILEEHRDVLEALVARLGFAFASDDSGTIRAAPRVTTP